MNVTGCDKLCPAVVPSFTGIPQMGALESHELTETPTLIWILDSH